MTITSHVIKYSPSGEQGRKKSRMTFLPALNLLMFPGIVYIGSIHPEHYKLSMLCLNAGKNVLCEKPVTMTLAAAKEVFSLAKEKKLFYMEVK